MGPLYAKRHYQTRKNPTQIFTIHSEYRLQKRTTTLASFKRQIRNYLSDSDNDSLITSKYLIYVNDSMPNNTLRDINTSVKVITLSSLYSILSLREMSIIDFAEIADTDTEGYSVSSSNVW